MFCGGMCINVERNASNCGSCGNRCPDEQVCRQSQCIGEDDKGPPDPPTQPGGLNVPELEKLLARFNITLQQFSRALHVSPAQLARTHVTLSDIEDLGITVERLMRAGITLDDLARIGVDIAN
jgi:hypothetical protein